MRFLGRLVLSLVAGALALVITFALIFGGGLLWEVHEAPHDGQAGIGPFFLALFTSPVVALLTFLLILTRWRKDRPKSGAVEGVELD